MYYIALFGLVVMIALIRRDGMKEVQERQEFKRHLDHIRAIFIHERERVQELRRSKLRHWSIGCEELRQTTMLEE